MQENTSECLQHQLSLTLKNIASVSENNQHEGKLGVQSCKGHNRKICVFQYAAEFSF
jgi:hypothetical protein